MRILCYSHGAPTDLLEKALILRDLHNFRKSSFFVTHIGPHLTFFKKGSFFVTYGDFDCKKFFVALPSHCFIVKKSTTLLSYPTRWSLLFICAAMYYNIIITCWPVYVWPKRQTETPFEEGMIFCDRQTNSQTDKQTNRQTDRQTDRLTNHHQKLV